MTDEEIQRLTRINIDTVDPEIYDLLTYINRVKGIRTTDSCFGHNVMECTIFGEADDVATLQKFIHDYFYGNTLWKIELYITDVLIDEKDWGKVLFCIRSDPSYIDFPTLQLMVTNLTRGFQIKQTIPEHANRLLLPIDTSVKLEDVITEQCKEEFKDCINLEPDDTQADTVRDTISRSALKDEVKKLNEMLPNLTDEKDKQSVRFAINILQDLIDNAPTVDTACPHCDSGYAQGFSDGYLRAKEDVIHSIAKQYSEHNELVPIWLSIGNMNCGADMRGEFQGLTCKQVAEFGKEFLRGFEDGLRGEDK